MFALIHNNTVHELFDTRPTLHPSLLVVDVSGTPDVAEGWVYDAETGTVTPPPAPSAEDILNHELRPERDARLAACDKWGMVDYRTQATPETLDAWDAYRQALRDLPQTVTDAELLARNWTWPERPMM